MTRISLLLVAVAAAGVNYANRGSTHASSFLFAWVNAPESAYFATIDVAPNSPDRGRVVATVAVGIKGGRAHHTEHELSDSGTLLANLFDAGRTFLFDVRDPTKPVVLRSFQDAGGFSHPHSFVRLPNGDILATFQYSDRDGTAAGGLVEFSSQGDVKRVSPRADSGFHGFVRPYSLAVVPALDRVVTTGHDMHQKGTTRVVQVWRLSDLALMHTIELPNGPRGVEGFESGEPRLLKDGKTVYVTTYQCGLYRLTAIDSASPRAQLVYDFSGQDCALPVQIDSFWIQTVPPHSIVALDISDSRNPRQVSRLELASDESPHWMSREPAGRRLAITGVGGLLNRILIANVDKAGLLSVDAGFTDAEGKAGIHVDGVPHGVVFSRQ